MPWIIYVTGNSVPVDSMIDDTRKSMQVDQKHGFKVLNITNSMPSMKRDKYNFETMRKQLDSVSERDTTDDTEEDDFSKKSNYQLLVILHCDSEMRPCRPIIRIASLPSSQKNPSSNRLQNPNGTVLEFTCQLADPMARFADPMANTSYQLEVDNDQIICVYALGLTDVEACTMIHKVSVLNNLFVRKSIVLSQRSNMALVPVFCQNSIPIGARCIDDINNASAATDVQIAIILMLESINKSRSLAVRINRLHPYLATPENLHEAVSMFMRKLDVSAFKDNKLKFMSL